MAKTENEPAPGYGAGFVSKIAVGQVGFKKIAQKVAETKKEAVIGIIMGEVTDFKTKTLDDGTETIALRGSFEATNAETGEVLSSGTCYLPSALEGLTVSLAKELQKKDAKPQMFAVELTCYPADNKSGYSYRGKNLVPQMSSDPLMAIRAEMAKAKK